MQGSEVDATNQAPLSSRSVTAASRVFNRHFSWLSDPRAGSDDGGLLVTAAEEPRLRADQFTKSNATARSLEMEMTKLRRKLGGQLQHPCSNLQTWVRIVLSCERAVTKHLAAVVSRFPRRRAYSPRASERLAGQIFMPQGSPIRPHVHVKCVSLSLMSCRLVSDPSAAASTSARPHGNSRQRTSGASLASSRARTSSGLIPPVPSTRDGWVKVGLACNAREL